MKSPDEKSEKRGVLVVYTGGTIGSMPKDRDDPESPQVVVPWEEFKELTPALNEEDLGFKVNGYSTEPLDSCNIGPKEWKEMADVIKKNYDHYEGFVILHGTDTMIYTASALSFMLQNLGKPVVVTGAQLASLFNVRNDALQNMITALMIANPKYSRIPVVPEVCIYFNGKLLRGNRTRKLDASSFDAYKSPNFPPLGIAGESIEIDERLIRKVPVDRVLTTRTTMETNVVAVNVFPGIQDSATLDPVLRDQNLKGVVLMAYGAGNIPTDPRVLKLIEDATKRGVIVLNVTQCGGGKVELGMYETSALLLDIGVLSGVDITPEAALCKLMLLLGDKDMTRAEIALKAEQAIAGEQSLSIYTTQFRPGEVSRIDPSMSRVRVPGTKIEGSWETADDIDRIMLRFRNGKITNEAEKPIEVKLFVNLQDEDELDEDSPNYLGSFRKNPNDKSTILFFDITERAKKVLGDRGSFTVVLAGKTGSFTWEQVELAIFVKEW